MDAHDQEAKKSGPLREQLNETARSEMHQTQLLKTSQSQQSIVVYKVSCNQSALSPDID